MARIKVTQPSQLGAWMVSLWKLKEGQHWNTHGGQIIGSRVFAKLLPGQVPAPAGTASGQGRAGIRLEMLWLVASRAAEQRGTSRGRSTFTSLLDTPGLPSGSMGQ